MWSLFPYSDKKSYTHMMDTLFDLQATSTLDMNFCISLCDPFLLSFKAPRRETFSRLALLPTLEMYRFFLGEVFPATVASSEKVQDFIMKSCSPEDYSSAVLTRLERVGKQFLSQDSATRTETLDMLLSLPTTRTPLLSLTERLLQDAQQYPGILQAYKEVVTTLRPYFSP